MVAAFGRGAGLTGSTGCDMLSGRPRIALQAGKVENVFTTINLSGSSCVLTDARGRLYHAGGGLQIDLPTCHYFDSGLGAHGYRH